ncbi:MAG: hypothetical protein AVDCRST_MAG75-3130 [uncultured Propionibacteriaceae bacterium]|uniref:VOC domain-containing protein n=1 Tax=uncultured Propionibacteriaceae bacterium TaxID=257457 RepID=A0A6J4PLE5_9ACTN|nr:MAG: hypothetical protein AVDCRST_MAG75-3130 [uncultured Propionibacteriaceae bacterium]
MEIGLYEQLVTRDLHQRLTALRDDAARTQLVDAGDQPHVLARHVEAAVQRVLSVTRDPDRRLAIINLLLDALEDAADLVVNPATQLLSVRGVAKLGGSAFEDVPPATPLTEAAGHPTSTGGLGIPYVRKASALRRIAMTFSGIGHVAITVSDLAESKEWYSRVLGWSPMPDGDDSGVVFSVGVLPGGVLRVTPICRWQR